MISIYEKIQEIGIVPVVKIDDVSKAGPLADALIAGNIPCAEVTFRTYAAKEAIIAMRNAFPDMLIGAGTVLTCEQVDQAIEAGAQFIVAPGFNPKTVAYCIERNIPIIPGVATASDIEAALSYGLTVLKFFPAEVNGGIKAIQALSGPYSNVRFMPTGGINIENIPSYLTDKNVIACGGTWMVNEKLINTNNFDEITRLSRETVELIHSLNR